MDAVLDYALSHPNRNLRGTAQSLLGKLNLPAETLFQKFKIILDGASIPEKQEALSNIAQLELSEARDLITKILNNDPSQGEEFTVKWLHNDHYHVDQCKDLAIQ